jgi:hypothetical protein
MPVGDGVRAFAGGGAVSAEALPSFGPMSFLVGQVIGTVVPELDSAFAVDDVNADRQVFQQVAK